MKLVIRSLGVWGHPNLRTWEPEDPEAVTEVIYFDVGTDTAKSADTFNLRIATPKGLEQLDSSDGIVAIRPLLVIKRYDFDVVWNWLQKKVAECSAKTWEESVQNLRYYFGWEYDNFNA